MIAKIFLRSGKPWIYRDGKEHLDFMAEITRGKKAELEMMREISERGFKP